jgi:hypothetical protein
LLLTSQPVYKTADRFIDFPADLLKGRPVYWLANQFVDFPADLLTN